MAIFSDSMFQANMGTQFESPYEGMYLNSPGWSMDSAYMSPSYMGNFRPSYGGATGFSPNNIPDFSYIGSLTTAGGITDTPYYLNPLAYRDAALSHATTAPADAAMWGMQNIATPLAAFAAGTAISGMTMPSMFGTNASQAAAGRASAHMGMAGKTAGAYWKTYVTGQMTQQQFARHSAARAAAVKAAAGKQSFGAFAGARVGSGFGGIAGRAMGGGIGAMTGAVGRLTGTGTISGGALRGASMGGRALGAAGGAMGAAGGALLMPFMLASGLTEVADEMIFDPYIASRRGQEAATSNFAGSYTGTSPFGTLGIGRGAAAQVGSALAQGGYEDRAFGNEGMINIFDMSMKAGLMSDVGNLDPEQIKKQVKNISKQVQAIMSVAGDPDVGRAIQSLANMKKLGISGTDASTTIQALGAAEAISGTSSLQIMNTVGTQASYMFQQAGIAPQGAMQAAASSYAGFSNAYKMGLINPSTLAMMGGTEGATQSLLSGQLGLGRSMYNQISLANRFMYGNEQSSVVGNVGAFGQQVANNPLAAMGALRMNSGPMIGAQLQENPLAPTQGIFQYLEGIPGAIGSDGKIRWDTFAGAGLSMGMSEDQMRSQLEMMKMMQSQGGMARMNSAALAKYREQYSSYIEREGLDFTGDGVIGSTGSFLRGAGLGVNRVKRSTAGMFSEISKYAGRAVDSLASVMYDYATPNKGRAMNDAEFSAYFRTGSANATTYEVDGPAGLLSDKRAMYKKVERALNDGSVSSADYMNAATNMNEADRLSFLQKSMGMSFEEASMFSRVMPTTIGADRAFMEEAGADMDKLRIYQNNETVNMDGLSKALGGLSGRAIMQSPKALSKVRGGSVLGTSLTSLSRDRTSTFENLPAREKVMSAALARQLATDPESLSKYLTSGDGDTEENKMVRRLLGNIMGISGDSISGSDLSRFNNKNFSETATKDILNVIGNDPRLRAAVESVKGDYSVFSNDERFDSFINTSAYEQYQTLSQIGINKVDIATAEDLNKLSDIERSAYEQQKQLMEMANTGQLDFTGYLEATNANKMSISADKFSKAADTFARAVAAEHGPIDGLSFPKE